MLSHIWIVFAKESIDNLRDRRSLFMALIYPFIGALLLGLLLSFVGSMLRGGKSEERVSLPVAGADNAPAIIAYLKERGVRILSAPKDPDAAVLAGDVDSVLVIPEDYAQKFAAMATVDLPIVINASRLSTVVTVSRVVQILREYGDSIGKTRLARYGVKAEIARPFAVHSVNVGQSRSLAGFFLNMLPPFVIFTIFVGGVYLAIDTTSGERERGSMEPLLANPVPRWQFMLAKALATLVFTMTAVVLQLIAFKVMFEWVVHSDFGIRINPGYLAFFGVFLIALPLMMFAVALQIIVATVSGSYKETQTYLGLLPLIPSLPGMILVFVPVKAAAWMMAIPTFGQILLIGKLMREEPVALTQVAVSVGCTAAITALLLYIAARLYERDQLLFGG